MSASETIRAVSGRQFGSSDFLMLFTARLDETGTDGSSEYVTLGGGVSFLPRWDLLERAWGHKLGKRLFHLVDFDARQGDFEGWGDLKCRLFENSLKKIIRDSIVFRVAISVNSKAHAAVKKRMTGIKGFRPDSDYGLCLRYLMFQTCEQLTKIDAECRLSIIVEDGPCSEGANATYQKVSAMQGKWKPARHAHRLAGFTSLPKGELRSLEVADYIVGREHARMLSGRKPDGRRAPVLGILLTPEHLETWYSGMLKEKGARRAFGFNSKAPKRK